MQAQIDALYAGAQEPLYLEKLRDEHQEKALREMTINSADPANLMDPSNPLLVEEELRAEKDHFRRLKFTYLEQESKRNFLFAITGDEPTAVQPGENEALEASNAEQKAVLKQYKAEVDRMFAESVEMAKENAARHARIRGQVSDVAAIQKQIREAELELARIKATHPPEKRLTVDQANQRLEDQTIKMQDLQEILDENTANIEIVREAVAKTSKEVTKLAREREREEARAKEVREGREAGDGKVDDLCRWLTSSIQLYRSLIGITSVTTSIYPSTPTPTPLVGTKQQHLLHITYDVPDASISQYSPLPRDEKTARGQAELICAFDPASRRFLGAELRGSDVDIAETVGLTERSQDVSGLVADVLARLRPIVV